MEVSRNDPVSLSSSLFNPGRKTMFYIHGWNNIGYRSSFTEELRNALLDVVRISQTIRAITYYGNALWKKSQRVQFVPIETVH